MRRNTTSQTVGARQSSLLLAAIAPLAVVLIGTQRVAAQTPPAALNPSDPALRLWLRADTLTAAGLSEGSPVTQWIDQSQYGTIMAPRRASNPIGPIGGFPVEENPHLQFATVAGNTFPTVRFDVSGDAFQTGDPNVDGSGARDRLYQTNNLDDPNTPEIEFDPLDIYDGSSLTSFVVFNPDYTTTWQSGNPASGWNAVFAKRGTNSSAYAFSIKNLPNFGNFVFVQYDAVEQYHSLSSPRPQEKTWHVSSMNVIDNPGTENADVVAILDDESQSDTGKMVSLGVGLANGTENNVIANRNPSVPEPFGIGAFSQACCGELERFSGNIAELIIFARTLTPQEFSAVEDYLDAKYFASPSTDVPGDYDGDGDVDDADLVAWEDQFSEPPPGSPNADGDGDGDVDGDDLLIWQANYGQFSAGIAQGGAVPEPGGVGQLVSAAMLAIVWARRGRRSK